MIESWLEPILTFFWGIGLGALFFHFLWFSIQKFVGQSKFVFLGILGYLIRLAMVGLSLLVIGKWMTFISIVTFLVGFFAMKYRMTAKIKHRGAK